MVSSIGYACFPNRTVSSENGAFATSGGAMSNRRHPQRRPLSFATAGADPWAGLDSPEAIEALERAAAELLNGSILEPRELVRGLSANEADRQALERGFGPIQHYLGARINALKVHSAELRNTAEARLVARSCSGFPGRA
jgi:hypothetical protein